MNTQKYRLTGLFLGLTGLALLPAAPLMAQRRPHVVHVDLDLYAAESVEIRTQKAPMQFDDKGKPRKPTSEELRFLKGPNRKLPGYMADWKDIQPNELVRVSLARKKHSSAKSKSSESTKEDAKISKKDWTSVGELTGQILRVEGKSAKKMRNRTDTPDVKEFTFRVDTVALGKVRGLTAKGGKGKKLDSDVFVTMIVILAGEKPGK